MPVADLRDLLESLPQELYDEIYKLTFASKPEPITTLTKDYKPPAIMQVDREMRAKVAREHYEKTIGVAEQSLGESRLDSVDHAYRHLL